MITEYLVLVVLAELAVFLALKILNEFLELNYVEPEKVYCAELSKEDGAKLMSELFGDNIDE